MALPDNTVRIDDLAVPFSQPEGDLRANPLKDFELAGIAIQNPDSGLNVRLWVCEKQLLGDVVLYPDDAPGDQIVLLNNVDISELSICFDRAMNPTLAYITPEGGRLRWYDSSILEFAIVGFSGTGCYLVLDDKSQFGNAYADVLLFYLRGSSLYYRQQRDRFLTERILHTFPGNGLFIRRAARCDNYRVQIELYGPDARA